MGLGSATRPLGNSYHKRSLTRKSLIGIGLPQLNESRSVRSDDPVNEQADVEHKLSTPALFVKYALFCQSKPLPPAPGPDPHCLGQRFHLASPLHHACTKPSNSQHSLVSVTLSLCDFLSLLFS